MGETKTVALPAYTPKEGKPIEFGMYPSSYTIGNDAFPFVAGSTAELKFRVFNNLDFPSPATITIVMPSLVSVKRNKGYEAWQDCIVYCETVDSGKDIPANSSEEVTVRVSVPEGVAHPEKWIFYVCYSSKGQEWGSYVTTLSKNFVFAPADFEASVSDMGQKYTWLTWGNSPDLIVRSAYGIPPQNITDGEAVNVKSEQIRKPWVYPETGQTLERQYTLYTIEASEMLPSSGGEKLFFRAWLKHMVYGVWDGNWDLIGQSMIVPEVQAKVLVNM